MSSKALALLLSLPLGLALTACGDDGGGGGDDSDTDPGTTTMDAPTTAGPTTAEPTTAGPTTAEPTTEDTIDPDTTMGETDDSSGETEDTDDTTVVEPMPADYRVNSIQLLDPHVFAPVIGDATGQANDALNMAMMTDDPEDPDGNLDLNFVLQFRDLDQADGATGTLGFVNAVCTAPEEGTSCTLLPKTTISETDYTSLESDTCYEAVAGNLGGYTPAPMATTGPCFSGAYDNVVIQAGLFALPLTDAKVAAAYVGNPAGNLVTGNIEGFLSREIAEQTMVSFSGFDFILSDLLEDSDMDGDGWIFHLGFTAVTTTWAGE